MMLLKEEADFNPAAFAGTSRTSEIDHSFLQIATMPLFTKLSPLQRVMFISNGTLTDILQGLG